MRMLKAPFCFRFLVYFALSLCHLLYPLRLLSLHLCRIRLLIYVGLGAAVRELSSSIAWFDVSTRD